MKNPNQNNLNYFMHLFKAMLEGTEFKSNKISIDQNGNKCEEAPMSRLRYQAICSVDPECAIRKM